MRVIARCFGLSVIFILSILIHMQMMIYNIRQDELINCISTAVTSTQIVMQEQIEDLTFHTSTRRKNIQSNEEYIEEFVKNFYKLTTTDSIYKIKVFGIDYTKGFLDVEVGLVVLVVLGGCIRNRTAAAGADDGFVSQLSAAFFTKLHK